MARRGGNLFKRNDGLRALKIARDGGIEPAMIEIVAKDGTVFRVYGDKAKGGSVSENPWERGWQTCAGIEAVFLNIARGLMTATASARFASAN